MRKRVILTLAAACLLVGKAGAWDRESHCSLNVGGSANNFFLAYGIGAVEAAAMVFVDDGDTAFKLAHFLPSIAWQLPITVSNSVPEGAVEMGSPWRRTFSNPFKNPGDFSIGLDFSYDHRDTPLGFYLTTKYKTTEVIMKSDAVMNHRAHYVTPGGGLRLRFPGDGGDFIIEAGAIYDMAFKYHGQWDDDGTDAINSGVCGDFALGLAFEKLSFTLRYQHPFYNYFNKDYTPDGGLTMPLAGMDRKVGYITATARIGF